MAVEAPTVKQQFRRLRNYFGFLREAEGAGDQIRLRGMGVIWPVEQGLLTPPAAAEYFDEYRRRAKPS